MLFELPYSTHTHVYKYIYIYTYICVCVCVYYILPSGIILFTVQYKSSYLHYITYRERGANNYP